MALNLAAIRRAARAGRVRWLHHALLRAAQRGIVREDALRVIDEGEVVEQHGRSRPFPKCLMMAQSRSGRPLYVALSYDEEENYVYIITVHWLDPRKWEDPWTRKHAET